MNTWFKILNKANATPEIDIYGAIGDSWLEESVSAAEFRKELNAISAKKLIVNINSPGGSVFDGLAIYNSLQRWKETNDAIITVNIDGLAASAASVIAMAGTDIRIPRNGMIMIHNASGFAIGDSRAMRKTAEILDGANQAIASVYADNNVIDRDLAVIKAQMDAETWFIGEEAVENGYATEVIGAIELQACFGDECKQRWRNAPDELNNFKTPGFLPSPAGRGQGEGNVVNHKECDMDEKQVQALIQESLSAQSAELTAEIAAVKDVAAKLGEQLEKSTTALADMAAKYDKLVAEVSASEAAENARIEAIKGLFAMFDTEADRPYREQYLGLKAECLGEKSMTEPQAREQLMALRNRISHGQVAAPVAGPTPGVPIEDTPESFMDKVSVYADAKNVSKGQAIKAIAHKYPELHQQWLEQQGA